MSTKKIWVSAVLVLKDSVVGEKEGASVVGAKVGEEEGSVVGEDEGFVDGGVLGAIEVVGSDDGANEGRSLGISLG
jgi:hypothetical protein